MPPARRLPLPASLRGFPGWPRLRSGPLYEVRGIIPPKWKRSVWAPTGFSGTVLRGAWLPFCSREWSGEAAFATRCRFQSGFAQVRDAPRPSQAAARCRSAERAPRSVGTWLHGRGCGSWALSPPGHHPPLLLLRLPRSLRGRDPRDARPVVRGALEQNLCLQRSLCFLPWVTGQPGLGHASGGRLSGVGSLQHVEMSRGDWAPSVYQNVVSPHSRWF